MGRVLSTEKEDTTSSGTEYRECYLSPRREDYGPRAVIPKVPVKRSLSNRSALSYDLEQNPLSEATEYRFCYENYRPKRPYVVHEGRSHVFDYVPKPLSMKPMSKLPVNPTNLNDTEYHERFPNYRSFLPTQELLPAHISAKPDVQSETQKKRDQMNRSQYFQQLIDDHDRLHGGHRYRSTSEQRTAFQWPPHISPSKQTPRQQQEIPMPISQPYSTPRNIYEPLPPIQRTKVNS
ncbi:unnamed protein product [Adineta steineri]|uniref:Uncharacterized protein n=2 Tax=Adineta steineri TaxID=433720 RepID=A0A818HQ56_9BILA|nr:unnamed protein product [Adineta steineri]CAF1256728.1 unnamed protein product [Adineta steineri]CAF3512485.1 unnamed protein product [Adineta steineri]CAF3859624.1 unnamed protein product [Adineta steineri]